MCRIAFAPIVLVIAMSQALAWGEGDVQSTHAGEVLGTHGHGHDAMHYWYKTLKHPKSGYDCCDGKDCRPTRARVSSGRLEVLVDGEWTRVPDDSVVKATPPDGRAHVCAQKGPWSPKVIFCVVLGPGV